MDLQKGRETAQKERLKTCQSRTLDHESLAQVIAGEPIAAPPLDAGAIDTVAQRG
jgi:hypothetical protein